MRRTNLLLTVIYATAGWVAGAGCVAGAAVPGSGKIAPVTAAAGDWFPTTGCGGGWCSSGAR
jgi:hypothetical protein